MYEVNINILIDQYYCTIFFYKVCLLFYKRTDNETYQLDADALISIPCELHHYHSINHKIDLYRRNSGLGSF